MKTSGSWLVGALAMTVACAGTEDETGWSGPPPVTVGNGSSPSPGDAGDTEGAGDTGDDDGGAEGPAPSSESSDDGGRPPDTDDGGGESTDDGGPLPSGDDDGPAPTYGCESFCVAFDQCGWLDMLRETIEECTLGCGEPFDMGPCDAAWEMHAGCLGTLDCTAIDTWMNGDDYSAPGCEAEAAAEAAACGF